MVSSQDDVFSDLTAEGNVLDRVVAGLDPADWAQPTPAPGWTIAHQVAHLTSIARIVATAASDPATFQAQIAGASGDFDAAVSALLRPYLDFPPEVLLGHWRAAREAAAGALAAVPADQVVPWLARPLPPAILASAGIMELFAHGQDILDTVGAHRPHTDRLGHLVAFAVRTWDFGYLARDRTPPDAEFRFEITAPSGALWAFGPPDATQKVTGPATDFCLLVTRRRHKNDLAIQAHGELASQWLDIAQCYRGTPGAGRSPGQFTASARAA
jgi:uncharacterized protein (TIGR03084 family)